MRSLSILLIILGFIFLSGCTSQARKTHRVFEREDATYEELHEALEALKPVGHEGATHHQYRAVKALRHIAKYIEDPAKREMGTRALVFLAFFNDDRNVRISSMSRIDAILDDRNQDLAQRVVIIDELEKIMTAKTGYTETDVSFLNNRTEYHFIFPEIDAREEALDFLTDRFEDLPEYLQYLSVRSFERFLQNPPTCYEIDDGVCDKDDAEDQKEWKQQLIEEIGEWLEDNTISPMIRTSLVRAVEAFAASAADQPNNPARTRLEIWAAEQRIPQQTRDIIGTALNKLDNIHEELVSTESSTTLAPFSANEDYRSLDVFNTAGFWYANAEQILKGQLFRPASSYNNAGDGDAAGFMQVPAQWILFNGYNDTPASKELRETVFYPVNNALKKGYLLSPTEDLFYALEQMITASADESDWALDRTLSVVSRLYPSLKGYRSNIDPLIQLLVGRISTETDIHRKRLFINTLLDGLAYYQADIEFAVCPEIERTDFLTKHLVKVKAASLEAPTKLMTVADYRGLMTSGTDIDLNSSQAEAESDQYLQQLCGEDISGLKPEPPVLLIIEEPPAETPAATDQEPAEAPAATDQEPAETPAATDQEPVPNES